MSEQIMDGVRMSDACGPTMGTAAAKPRTECSEVTR
jgi:hypothetical protein